MFCFLQAKDLGRLALHRIEETVPYFCYICLIFVPKIMFSFLQAKGFELALHRIQEIADICFILVSYLFGCLVFV